MTPLIGGAYWIDIDPANNLNDCKTPGSYRAYNSTNAPTEQWGVVTVNIDFTLGTEGAVVQNYHSNNNIKYYRVCKHGVWSSWEQIVTNSNLLKVKSTQFTGTTSGGGNINGVSVKPILSVEWIDSEQVFGIPYHFNGRWGVHFMGSSNTVAYKEITFTYFYLDTE